MAIWDDLLTQDERERYAAYTAATPRTLGDRPVLLVVDVNYEFVGPKPEPYLQAIKTYLNSCGEDAWAALPHIQSLIRTSRDIGIPIIYSTGMLNPLAGGGWGNRARGSAGVRVRDHAELEHDRAGKGIVEAIAPMPGEVVLTKRAASVFSGTPLLEYLNEMDADTVLIVGTTTSGCVRATAVDAACASFYVGVVEECTFDRFALSHKVSLMDIHGKYGKVISLSEAERYLSTEAIPIGQSAERRSVG